MTAGVVRARVAELADAPHSKCGIERCVGSSPTSGTVFSLFGGLVASECARAVHLWAPAGAIFVGGCCGLVAPSLHLDSAGRRCSSRNERLAGPPMNEATYHSYSGV